MYSNFRIPTALINLEWREDNFVSRIGIRITGINIVMQTHKKTLHRWHSPCTKNFVIQVDSGEVHRSHIFTYSKPISISWEIIYIVDLFEYGILVQLIQICVLTLTPRGYLKVIRTFTSVYLILRPFLGSGKTYV